MELTSITVDLKTQQGTVELAGQFLGRDVRLRIIGAVIQQEGELPVAAITPTEAAKPTPQIARTAPKPASRPAPKPAREKASAKTELGVTDETWQQSVVAELKKQQPCTRTELLDHVLRRRHGNDAVKDRDMRDYGFKSLWAALDVLVKRQRVLKIEENGLDKLRLAPEPRDA